MWLKYALLSRKLLIQRDRSRTLYYCVWQPNHFNRNGNTEENNSLLVCSGSSPMGLLLHWWYYLFWIGNAEVCCTPVSDGLAKKWFELFEKKKSLLFGMSSIHSGYEHFRVFLIIYCLIKHWKTRNLMPEDRKCLRSDSLKVTCNKVCRRVPYWNDPHINLIL